MSKKMSPFDVDWVHMGPFSFSPSMMANGKFVWALDGKYGSFDLPTSIGTSSKKLNSPVMEQKPVSSTPSETMPAAQQPQAPVPQQPSRGLYAPIDTSSYQQWLSSLRSVQPYNPYDINRYLDPRYRGGM